jgi:hypothetical protein
MESWRAVDTHSRSVESQNGIVEGRGHSQTVEAWSLKMESRRAVDTHSGSVEFQYGTMNGRDTHNVL